MSNFSSNVLMSYCFQLRMYRKVTLLYSVFSALVAFVCGLIFIFSELTSSIEAEENIPKLFVVWTILLVVAYISALVIIQIILPRHVAEF